MRALFSFAPFIGFAVALRFLPLQGACLIAATIGLSVLLRDKLANKRSIIILEAGSVILYGGLALVTYVLHPGWSMWSVWVINDAGLLLIALGSLAIGMPFSLQYAREQVAPEFWDNPVFLAVNRRITLAWACAFAVMLLCKLAAVYLPGTPGWAAGAGSILACVAAVRFTSWYPARVRRIHTSPPPTPA